MARAALNGGAWGLAVATLEEADELDGLVKPERVLVMGGLTPEQAGAAAASGCSIGVSSLEFAKALGDRDEVVPVHLKIDTGMGRFGCRPDEAAAIAKFIDDAPSLRLAGTWTHFASADSDEAMTRKQFDRFIAALETFEVEPGLRHACNSAGAHRFPEFALDAVRAGIALYGCEWPGTKPALALRSVVTHLKTVGPGDTVGYGATWRATAQDAGRHRRHRLRRRGASRSIQPRPRADPRPPRAADRSREHGRDHRRCVERAGRPGGRRRSR